MSDEIIQSGDGSAVLVRVDIPDAKTQKCIVLNPHDTVWRAKQIVLEKINQDLPRDILNYSLYLPPSGVGKLGKFLEDQQQLADYGLQGRVPRLEMRYKTRDYSIQVSLSEKAIIKANSKANQKKMMDYVSAGSVKKVEKLLEAGLDPNFVSDDGNTPLGVACGRNSHNQCIAPLLAGGAHIDFRGKDGLTPMHRAAIGGNAQAIQILLSYGALPNYRDAKGLTPVYHTAIMGDDPGACMALLRHKAEMGMKDQGGWTELHQTSKYGHTRHADLFIRYGADINAQNLVGNTPLHVAASHGQTLCAMLLLKRGADKMSINFSSQTPGQVAILCGHHQLATDISGYSPEQVERMVEPPEYNPNARQFDQMFVEKRMTDMCPLVPPAETLVDSLTQEWEEKEMDDIALPPMGRKGSTAGILIEHRGRSGSISSKSSSVRFPGETESISSMDQDSTHSGSTTGTPVQSRNFSTFHNQRERLHRAGPARYVAMENVEPQQSGDVPLRRGVPVEVVYIGKGGYWEGKSGGRQGWFPALAIKELTEGEEVDFGESEARMLTPTADDTRDYEADREEEDEISSTTFSGGKRFTGIKDVIVSRGTKGYGFAMRGVKATKAMKFHPTPQVPALQYVGNVDPGGSADLAGLQQGDFIIEVNGYNVTYSTHDEVVNIVRKSGATLHLKIITPLIKPKSASTIIREQLTPVSTPDKLRRYADTPDSSAKFHSSEMLASLEENPDKETAVQGGNRRLTDSPVLERINRSGWDSSQDDLDSPDPHRKFTHSSHHIAPVQPSPSKSPVGVRAFPILHSSQDQETQSQPEADSTEWDYNLPEYGQAQSAALPAFPPKDYSRVRETVEITNLSVDSLASDEDDSDSVFTRAIRERKEKGLTKIGPIQRARAATMPEGEDRPKLFTSRRDTLSATKPPASPASPPEEEEPLSFLERQLLQAAQDRDKRMSLSRPRMKEIKRTKGEAVSTSVSHNSLAKAVMKKIDSVVADYGQEHSSSDEFESPEPSPARYSLQRKAQSSTKSKGPPPTVKPKPLYKANTIGEFESKLTEKSEEPPKTPTMEENSHDATSPPWSIQLKKTPTNTRKIQSPEEEARQEDTDGGSPVNWKAMLKPTKTATNGRASPLSESSGEISSTRQFRQARPSSPAELKPSGIAKVFEVEPTSEKQAQNQPQEKRQHIGSLPQSSSEGVSMYEGSSVTSVPKYYQSKSRESFDETYWEAGGETTTGNSDSIQKPGVEDKDLSEAMHLPPPMPLIEKRISTSESIEELPPPPPFVSLEGIDGGETSTDDIIPPPSFPGQNSGLSTSPTPPPLPDTSPPKMMPGSNLPPKFEFPVVNGNHGQCFAPQDIASPIPSPLEQFESENSPEPSPHVVPPTAFGAVPEDGHQIDSRQLNLRDDSSGRPNEDEEVSELEESDIPPPLPSEPPPSLDVVEETERKEGSEMYQETLPPPRDTRTEVLTNATVEQTNGKSSLSSTNNVSRLVNTSQAEATNQPNNAVPPRPPPPLTYSKPTETAPTGNASISKPLISKVAPERTIPPQHGYAAEPTTAKERQAETKRYMEMPIGEWDTTEVCEWLRDVGLGEHCGMFEENEIMGEHLADLSKDELKELGIKKLGHQKTFASKLSLYTK